ncbi:hypothetical protein LX36DRAFT_291266 [Colletotrichum falcatum]|nr:hypothetical protein LX36DRAFT_291266 [Colletotrichum falcatum]
MHSSVHSLHKFTQKATSLFQTVSTATICLFTALRRQHPTLSFSPGTSILLTGPSIITMANQPSTRIPATTPALASTRTPRAGPSGKGSLMAAWRTYPRRSWSNILG